jgi:hypothetical protein
MLGAGLRPRRNRRPKVSRNLGDLRSVEWLGQRPATAFGLSFQFHVRRRTNVDRRERPASPSNMKCEGQTSVSKRPILAKAGSFPQVHDTRAEPGFPPERRKEREDFPLGGLFSAMPVCGGDGWPAKWRSRRVRTGSSGRSSIRDSCIARKRRRFQSTVRPTRAGLASRLRYFRGITYTICPSRSNFFPPS